MYNYVMLMGKVKEIKDEMVVNKRVTHLVISCARPFKNVDGVRETDDIDVRLCEFLADIVKEKVAIDETITVKGRLCQSNHPGLCYVIGEQIVSMQGEDER